MVMIVTLLQENRGTDFGYSSTPLPILWQAMAEDWTADPSFGYSGEPVENPADVAQVRFRMPFEAAKNLLPLSAAPQSGVYYQKRARYAQIQNGLQKRKTWLIQTGIIDRIDAGMADVTLRLESPLAWISKYPSRNNTSGQDLVGSRTDLLHYLTLPLSTTPPEDGEPFKALPIRAFSKDFNPSEELRELGYVRGSEVDSGASLTVPAPDPLPVEEVLQTVMSGWGSGLGTYGLTAIEETAVGGPPMWRFVLWKRVIAPRKLSYADLMLYSLEFTNEFTDRMIYDDNNRLEHRYLGGHTIKNPALNGAWLGIETESYSKADPNGTLPLPGPGKPNFDLGGDIGGGGFGGGFGGGGFGPGGSFPDGGFSGPGIGGNSLIPVEGGGYITPGGATPPVEVDTRALVLQVKIVGNGNSIRIPTYSSMPAAEPTVPIHNWKVFIDDVFHQDISIDTSEDGYLLTSSKLADGQEHIIKIVPTDGKYSPGWCCRFGNGPLTVSNNWLLRVLAMGTGAYTSPGGHAMPHAFQFNGMSRLISVAAPDQLAKVSDQIPSNFHYRRFSLNLELTDAPVDGIDMSEWTGKLPDRWKNQEFNGCPKLKTIPPQQPMPKVTGIGNMAYARWLNLCPNAILPALPTFESVTTVGDSALRGMAWGSKDSTPDRSIRNIFPKATKIGFFFMQGLNGYGNGEGSASTDWPEYVPAQQTILRAAYWPLLPSVREIGDGAFESSYAYTRMGADGPAKIDDMPTFPNLERVLPSARNGNRAWIFRSTFSYSNAIVETMRESVMPKLRSVDGIFGGFYGGLNVGSLRFYNPEVFPFGIGTWPQNSAGTGIMQDYRYFMYSSSLSPAVQKSHFNIIETTSKSMTAKPASYRAGNWRNNGYTGDSGSRIGYTDGSDVIMGQNGIPTPSGDPIFSPGFYR